MFDRIKRCLHRFLSLSGQSWDGFFFFTFPGRLWNPLATLSLNCEGKEKDRNNSEVLYAQMSENLIGNCSYDLLFLFCFLGTHLFGLGLLNLHSNSLGDSAFATPPPHIGKHREMSTLNSVFIVRRAGFTKKQWRVCARRPVKSSFVIQRELALLCMANRPRASTASDWPQMPLCLIFCLIF